ncbi:hypothetical protein BD289DRAFT_448951 [Coniella lustricola]|uniref:Uncharacterized protein n=1 Tax=Coniella lustricola TaxID=2025994 RepID=A0A2T2ZRQ5_9PEZI|nr:hypothetical protein BD289DRAFT_448951 [Coniella lustricola]
MHTEFGNPKTGWMQDWIQDWMQDWTHGWLALRCPLHQLCSNQNRQTDKTACKRVG